jgi:hypothetical protein
VIKTAEQEHQLKLAIRDAIARNPLMSVVQLQDALKERGFKTAQGNPLDWRYVSRLVRKLNREKALSVDQQKIQERLAITKERFRVMIETLWRIIEWKSEYIDQYNIFPPKNEDRIKAINTILKLDLAILKAEMDAGIFERKLGSVDLNVYRAQILPAEVAEKIMDVFKRWGIDLTLPQRPKLIEAHIVDASRGDASREPAQDGGQGVPVTS